MSFNRSHKEVDLIKKMRGSLRRMKRIMDEIDCFDTVLSSNDPESFPKVLEKLLEAEKILGQARDL